MVNAEMLKILVESEKGLSTDERAKLTEGNDLIYIDSRIDYHKRKARRQVAGIVLLIIYALFTLGVILFANNTDTYTAGLFKGIAAGYLAALVVLFPKTFRNHSRIAFILSVIKKYQLEKQHEVD